MEARELRIGNWIEKSGEFYQATGITISICEDEFWARPNPIPLTEEWLLKFGFSDVMQGVPSFHNGMFGLFWENGSLFLLNQGVCLKIPYIKSVHHLQNLYFALTGEELTTKQS